MKLRPYIETFPDGEKRDAELARLAKAAGRTVSAVRSWVYGTREVPPKKVIPVSEETAGKVLPHELRPDIYPAPKRKVRGKAAARSGEGAR